MIALRAVKSETWSEADPAALIAEAVARVKPAKLVELEGRLSALRKDRDVASIGFSRAIEFARRPDGTMPASPTAGMIEAQAALDAVDVALRHALAEMVASREAFADEHRRALAPYRRQAGDMLRQAAALLQDAETLLRAAERRSGADGIETPRISHTLPRSGFLIQLAARCGS